MYNTHYVVIDAKSHIKAVAQVQAKIATWGTENNWRTVFGAVNTKGIKVITDPIRNGESDLDLKGIRATFDKLLIRQPHANTQKVLAKLKAGRALASMEWYEIKVHAEFMCQVMRAREATSFDVWKDTFFDWRLDEFGITNLAARKAPKSNLYIVGVDMHS